MSTPQNKPGIKQTVGKNPNFRAQDLTSKHGKAMAHKAPERRMSSKGRGR